MLKKFLAMTLISVLILSCGSMAFAETMPSSLEKPQNVSVRSTSSSELMVRWTNPVSIQNFADDGHSFLYAIDWKKNNGGWNIGEITPGSSAYNDEVHGYFFNELSGIHQDDSGASESFLVTWHFDPKLRDMDVSSSFDLVNDTYSFRVRYVLETYEDEFGTIKSPYSEVVTIGKGTGSAAVTKIDAPVNLKTALKKDSNSKPYFQLDWTTPDSVTAVNKQSPVYHIIDFKVGNGKWLSETTAWDSMPQAPSGLLKSADTFDPIDEGLTDAIVIEENTYYFRVAYVCEQPAGAPVISAYSNIVSTKSEAYSNASAWAKPELQKAVDANLIPDILMGADMTKPITREEFAEVALLMYQKASSKADIESTNPNPFSDTQNQQILKAHKLGIIKGMSETTFAPQTLINREQVAAMLTRTIKLIAPNADYSTAGTPSFTDQADISGWALNDCLYIAKLGVIKGSDGKFMPRAITQAQIAEGYANTSREQALAMSVRTVDKII